MKPMVVSTHRPSRTAARLAPDPRWREDHAALRRVGPGDSGQFFHQVRVRQPVEPVAADARGLEPPGDRDDLRHPGQVVVERRVEANHLGQVRVKSPERLDQRELAGDVVRVERGDLAEVVEQPIGHFFRPVVWPPVHDPVPDGGDRPEPEGLPDPVGQQTYGRFQARGINASVSPPLA